MLESRSVLGCKLILTCLALLSSIITIAGPSDAAVPIYYAGFALAGNASDSVKNFPVTSELLQDKEESGVPRIESLLWESLASSDNADILRTALVDRAAGNNAVAVAFVLDWENVSREPVLETTKMVADLHGQILIFDFDTKKVIAAYPVGIQLIDVVEGTPRPQYEQNLIKSLYYTDLGKGILGAFAEQFSKLDIKRSYGNYLGVADVKLEEKALATLEQYGEDPLKYTNSIADNFGKRLSDNLGVPYVPYSKGSAIGRKMVARFSSGMEYQFELPSPDYRIHLTVRGFKKVPLDSNSVVTAWAYGSYLRVKITDFDDATTYLDAPFKYGAVKKALNATESLDDWTIYQESMFSLIDQVTYQLGNPDRQWITEWSDGRETLKQIEVLENIIARSR